MENYLDYIEVRRATHCGWHILQAGDWDSIKVEEASMSTGMHALLTTLFCTAGAL